MGTPFTAIAGLLVSTKRCEDVSAGAVEVDHTGAQAPDYGHGFFFAGAVNIAGKTVHRIIGNADGFFKVLDFS